MFERLSTNSLVDQESHSKTHRVNGRKEESSNAVVARLGYPYQVEENITIGHRSVKQKKYSCHRRRHIKHKTLIAELLERLVDVIIKHDWLVPVGADSSLRGAKATLFVRGLEDFDEAQGLMDRAARGLVVDRYLCQNNWSLIIRN